MTVKPDNILLTEERKQSKVCDFGNSLEEKELEVTPQLAARYYRAPEVILGLKASYPMDMWSAACTIFELATGCFLFSGRTDNEMLMQMIETKGNLNNKMIRKGIYSSEYFDEHNFFISKARDEISGAEFIKKIPQAKKPERDLSVLLGFYDPQRNPEEKRALAHLRDLLESCLILNPKKRITPEMALRHSFFDALKSHATI